MDGLGRKGSNIMYHYVKDKDYLKCTYSTCSDIVNQLVQHLKKYGIESRMSLVGSGGRNMVTQNEKEAIDFDFNLEIIDLKNFRVYDGRQLKETVRKALLWSSFFVTLCSINRMHNYCTKIQFLVHIFMHCGIA